MCNDIPVDRHSATADNLDSVTDLIECNLGNLLLSCTCRSPSLNIEQEDKVFNYFTCLYKYGFGIEQVFVGDFNFKHVSWLSGTVQSFADSVNLSTIAERKYMDCVQV